MQPDTKLHSGQVFRNGPQTGVDLGEASEYTGLSNREKDDKNSVMRPFKQADIAQTIL